MGRTTTDTAHLARYAVSLADAHTHELGFLPKTIYEPAAARGRLYTEQENQEPCGFLLRGPRRKIVRVYQTVVQLDARLIDHATAMVQRLVTDANDAGCHRIALWCAEDLDANAFWKALGFQLTAQRIKPTRSRRPHNGWTLELPAGHAHRAAKLADPKHQTKKRLVNVLFPNARNRKFATQTLAAAEE